MLKKEELIVNNLYWDDGNALRTNKIKLKYVGNKYVIVESLCGMVENWHTLDFFLKWATKA